MSTMAPNGELPGHDSGRTFDGEDPPSTPSHTPPRGWVRTRIACHIVTVVSLCAAALCYVSYRMDRLELRAVARRVVGESAAPSDKVLALLHWVYQNQGFRENRRYFLIPGLRATPLQVLEAGGDCADKSRLLTALLREVGVPCTMVLCFDPLTRKPVHTVVDAEIENGHDMIVDPVYDLHFPRLRSADYYGLLELRKDPGILPRRLDELASAASRKSPVRSYNRASAVYDHASSINWKKNGLTSLAHALLRTVWGEDVYRFHRPLVLEEPKLYAGALSLIPAVMAVSVVGYVRRCRKVRSADHRLFGPHSGPYRLKSPSPSDNCESGATANRIPR